MKNVLLSLMLLVGCSVDKEKVKVTVGAPGAAGTNGTNGVDGKDGAKGDTGATGKDGSSCSVAPAYAELEDEYYSLDTTLVVIGAKISCDDGTSQIVYNGSQGVQGIQGIQGETGEQGVAGSDGLSCSTSTDEDGNVVLSCPDQESLVIHNGAKGDKGDQGIQGEQGIQGDQGIQGEQGIAGDKGDKGDSCTVKRQSHKKRIKITCGHSVSYVYDGKKGKTGNNGQNGQNGENGQNGLNGTSCTAFAAPGGANVVCGESTVFLANGAQGPAGTTGPQGQPGRDGLNGSVGATGADGEDAIQPGLLCNVHNLSSTNGDTKLPDALKNSPVVGSFVLANLSVGDSPSANGFPGMPANLRTLVGDTDYALDCSGYLNIKTSGEYTLKLLSDDGARLSIEDSYLLVEDQGLHAPHTVSGTKLLNKGPNKFNIVYFQGPATQIALQLKMSGPNMTEAVVPASDFTH